MLGVNMTSFAAYLKNLYHSNNYMNGLMVDDPILRRLEIRRAKRTSGDKIVIPLRYGRNRAQSKDFSKSQEHSKTTTGARGRFEVPHDTDSGVARVSNKVILASRNDEGAFIKAFRDEIDDEIESLRQKRCTALFAPAANVAGEITTGGITNSRATVKIAANCSIMNFDVNDRLQFAAKNGASVRGGGPYRVTSVDRANESFTVTPALGSAVVVGDYIYRDGDFGQVALTSFFEYVKGGSTPGTLHGLNRNPDPLRLAGRIYQMGKDDRFTDYVRRVASRIQYLTGKQPTAVYCNSLHDQIFADEQTENTRLNVSDGGANDETAIGMGRLFFQTSGGRIDIVSSPFVPRDRLLVVHEPSFFIEHLGEKFVDFAVSHGDSMFKEAHDALGIEIRIESYGNLCCEAPGLSAVVMLSTDSNAKSGVPSF